MGDACACRCHHDPSFRNIHVCGCVTPPPVVPAIVEPVVVLVNERDRAIADRVRAELGDDVARDFEAAMIRYGAQAEIGTTVAQVVLEHARGNCPRCERMLDINQMCPAGCLDAIGLDSAAPRPTSCDRFGGRNR